MPKIKVSKRFFTLIIIISFSLVSFYSVSNFAQARIEENSEINIKWWNNNWTECKCIEIYNPGSRLINYTIPFSLTSDNFDYSKGQEDGEDLRILHRNNYTLFNFWVEKWNYLGTSKIWIEIPYIESHDTITIFMYYGNELASSISNGSSLFEFFDDFSSPLDLSKWIVHEYTGYIHNYTVEDGFLHVYTEATGTGPKASGYGFEPNVLFDSENFEIYLSSRWENLDNYSGQGRWNSLILHDNDIEDTGLSLALADDQRCIYYLYNDGNLTIGNLTEYNNGESYFKIKSYGNDFNISLSGSYDINYNVKADDFSLPFNLEIETILSESIVPPVSVDVYYDYFFVRETTLNEEPIINVIQVTTSTSDVTLIPITLTGICLIMVAVIHKKKQKNS